MKDTSPLMISPGKASKVISALRDLYFGISISLNATNAFI
jgi:hypothetical protein